MPIKFLYIDDEKKETIHELVELIESSSEGELSIHHEQVMDSIHAVGLFARDQQFDGILIDQDLKAISDDGNKADYFGTTLAQQLRTEMAVQNIPPLPLVLISYEEIILNQLEPDDSAKNLFDAVIRKRDLKEPIGRNSAAKHLLSLVRAYQTASNFRKDVGQDLELEEVREILHCDQKTFEQIDTRFIDFLSSKASDPHALVGAIFSTLVQSAGMLVTEKMLQTKLGVSSDSEDWETCKALLNEYKYKGPFSQIKDRWWFSRVEDWWFELCPESVLQSLTCSERVDVLKSKLGLDKLSPIPIRYPNGEQSQNLWVNCVLSGTPLDPFDALRVRDPEAKSWEQPKYMDVKAHIEDSTEPKKFVVHTDDQKKIRKLLVRLKPDVNG
tara:strand:+ start:10909 stop:12063 length:1155 start_codon:yes stop_codon:yes gene_type:complete